MDRLTIDGNMKGLPQTTTKTQRGSGFGDRLKQAVEAVNDQQLDADSATEQVIQGTMGIHEGMLAVSKADISLRLLLQVRNKVMEAYREITRMSF